MRLARTAARAVRAVRGARAYGTFDTLRAWLTGARGVERASSGGDLSLEDFVSLVERAEIERASSPERASARAHAAELSFPASTARAIVRGMGEEERREPGRMSPRRRAELGGRAEVDELLRTHALARAIARRCAEMDRVPESVEDLAAALRVGDAAMGETRRRAEAAAMRGAYPGNRPCPCGSMRKFKRCCGAAA